jgi:flagellar basal-body rod modification protein FlgD
MTSSTNPFANLTTATSVNTQNSNKNNASSVLGDDIDMFLSLLTTQLQNQSPLDPMDTDQLTDQLAKFSSVEQQIRTNDQLEQLIQLTSLNSSNAIVSYLNQRVTADGNTANLTATDSAKWSYDAAANAPDTEMRIYNESSQLIYSEKVSLKQGKGVYEWDGQTSTGQRAPEGTYSLSIAAKDSNGNPINVKTQIDGIVTGIDLSGNEPILEVGNTKLPLDSILTISSTL